VKVHGIQSFQTPTEMTDEIAQNFGPDFETVADLHENIRENALEEAKQQADLEYVQKVVEGLVEMSDIDYPPVAVELEIDRIVRNFDMRVRQMGLKGMEQYLELTNQSVEEYRESLREEAERSLLNELALVEFAQCEHLKVSDEEFEEHIGNVAGPLPEDADEEAAKARADLLEMMRADHSRPLVDSEILKDKSIKMLLAIARGEEVPVAVADAIEAPDAEQPAEVDSDDGVTQAESATAEEAAEEAAES
jgi:trigger factor